jgi:hypothetical protein
MVSPPWADRFTSLGVCLTGGEWQCVPRKDLLAREVRHGFPSRSIQRLATRFFGSAFWEQGTNPRFG